MSTSHNASISIKTPRMSPQIPIPIPLTSTSSFQNQNIHTIPKIKNNDQLPDRATLKTLSSFIKSCQNSPTQSTTSLSISIPLQHTPPPTLTTATTTTTRSSLRQPAIATPTLLQTQTNHQILSASPLDQTPTINMSHTTTTVTTRTTRGQPAHHHHRKPSIGDKISGALLKLRGSLTRRPGLKAAGTRRMRGTDGRGSHHVSAY
ncbi:15148306-875d-4c8b-8d52-62887d8defec [Sclerotinia trifoliorum]|uniref:15148306-875d-4c8b-8d52-62887d8defec n=1 Tax=Sclerotinia trifoliorum TaxID=28548 RepID=A0A8H2ZTT1_9HELO|nr:15148306-875d-4c8b-8d52-62887d8defec [Sclerotinia trifoliorum]